MHVLLVTLSVQTAKHTQPDINTIMPVKMIKHSVIYFLILSLLSSLLYIIKITCLTADKIFRSHIRETFSFLLFKYADQYINLQKCSLKLVFVKLLTFLFSSA